MTFISEDTVGAACKIGKRVHQTEFSTRVVQRFLQRLWNLDRTKAPIVRKRLAKFERRDSEKRRRPIPLYMQSAFAQRSTFAQRFVDCAFFQE